MSRRTAQIVCAVLFVGWCVASGWAFITSILGDCLHLEYCETIERLSVGLVVWRWLAGSLILFGGYRFFHRD